MTNAKRNVMREMPITNAERMYALDEAWNARDHREESIRFCRAFPDNNGTVIQPTGKPFDVLYSTAARWRDGKIIEEYLFYDNGTFLTQVGLA
jgi:hypothetical protein